MKQRFAYTLLTAIFLILCILIVVLFSSNQFIRGFLGDAIIVMLMYSCVKIVLNISPLVLSVGVTLLAYSIEISQYFKIITLLGFEENLFTRIVFGSVFDPLDLIAYTLGGISIYLLDSYFIQKLEI